MSDIAPVLQSIGFNANHIKKIELPWRIYFSWSSCDHDNWLIRRNKLKENDIRLNVGLSEAGWKVTLEAKHNLYRLDWRPSGVRVTADLPKYSRMTRWPILDNFLLLPDLILQLEQLSEFRQKSQQFSRQVKLDTYYVDLEKDFDQTIFTHWLGSTLGSLLLPSEKIEDEEDYSTPVRDYPVATTTEPGFPFADTNLKLAIMDSLLSEKLLDLGRRDEFYQFIEKHYPDTSTDNIAFAESAYDYLSRYPLTNEQLINVKDLYLDGSSDIYSYIDKFYDGETLEFCIKSLKGIEHCPSITEFSDNGFSLEKLDLSPLTQLPQLKIISLDGYSYSNTESFLSIASLRTLQCNHNVIDKNIVDALIRKGVTVKKFS